MLRVVLITFLFTACQSSTENLLGDWRVESRHYNATYRIAQEEAVITARLLYSKDGTSSYDWEKQEPRYRFLHLKQQTKDHYVDATSGATASEPLAIEQIAKDTLVVTLAAEKKEYWTRINQ